MPSRYPIEELGRRRPFPANLDWCCHSLSSRRTLRDLREDVALGWEALDQWVDDVAPIEPLTGGVGVNEVWSVRVNGQLAVGRLGDRSDADLSWETELLRHPDREGMTVRLAEVRAV